MRSRQGQRDFDLFALRRNGQMIFQPAHLIAPAQHPPLARQEKLVHPFTAALRTPQVVPKVVGVDYCHAGITQAFIDAALFSGNGLDRAHASQMCALGVGHQRHRWPGDTGEVGNLPRMIHAHLDDRGTVTGIQFEQRQRQPYVIIEVTLGNENGIAKCHFQNAGDHFLGRRLAIAAGHRNQRQRKAGAPVGCQRTERQTGIGYNKQRQADWLKLLERMGIDHRSGGTTRLGGGDEFMTIEVIATQGNKQFSASELPAVG